MTPLLAAVGLVYRLGLLVLVIVFTVQTSRGNSILAKGGKFVGLCLSIVPLIGLVLYVVARGKPSGYGERCGIMAILGMLLYALVRAGH